MREASLGVLSLHKHHRVYGDAARDYMFALLFSSMSSVSQVAHWNGYYDVHGCHVSLSHQLDTAYSNLRGKPQLRNYFAQTDLWACLSVKCLDC